MGSDMSNVLRFPTAEKRIIAKPDADSHHADMLSFMRRIPRREGGGIDSWVVEPAGHYVDQCEQGKRLAREFLSYIGQYPTVGNAYLLSDIVLSMVEKARHGQECKGLYVGFLHQVGRYAMAAAATMRPGEAE